MGCFNIKEEKKLWKRRYKFVFGIDEAGRGPLAGPVVAASVWIKKEFFLNGQFLKLKDSKKITPKKREEIFRFLRKSPFIKWSTGRVSEKIIDKINILEATKLAMKRAVNNLERKLRKQKEIKKKNRNKIFLILDGNFKINHFYPQKSIIKADENVFSCQIASIVAKIIRDRIIERKHKLYPEYRFDKHKGYPTKLHIKLLKKLGPSEIHRKSFGPVARLLNK